MTQGSLDRSANPNADYFNLPDLDISVLKCREEELFHWLRHLNAVLKYVANDYVSKQFDPSDRIEELNRELERAKGEQGLLINQANESIIQELTTIREALTASQTLSIRLDKVEKDLADLTKLVADHTLSITEVRNDISKLKTQEA